MVVWSTTQVNNEGHDQEANDGDDLDTRKNELGFSIDLNSEDIQADDQSNDQRDPDCNTDMVGALPVLDDDGGGRDFGTKCNCGVIPVLYEEGKSVSCAFALV